MKSQITRRVPPLPSTQGCLGVVAVVGGEQRDLIGAGMRTELRKQRFQRKDQILPTRSGVGDQAGCRRCDRDGRRRAGRNRFDSSPVKAAEHRKESMDRKSPNAKRKGKKKRQDKKRKAKVRHAPAVRSEQIRSERPFQRFESPSVQSQIHPMSQCEFEPSDFWGIEWHRRDRLECV